MGQFVANAATAIVPLAMLTGYRMYKNSTKNSAKNSTKKTKHRKE